jgi:tetratricopeptide (TPR) repeat protein
MGSRTVNSVWPGLLVTLTPPPCAATTACTIARPSPVLPFSRERDVEPRATRRSARKLYRRSGECPMNDALLQNAWRLQQEGKTPEAARVYSEILRADPRNFDALLRLGVIYLENKGFADAERLFAAAARIDSQSPEPFYNRGCALRGMGRSDDALSAFAHALALKFLERDRIVVIRFWLLCFSLQPNHPLDDRG